MRVRFGDIVVSRALEVSSSIVAELLPRMFRVRWLFASLEHVDDHDFAVHNVR